MTVQTLRPNGVNAAGSFTAVPSGTLAAVTSDNSDSTYALAGSLNNPMYLDLGTYALASNERVKLFQTRIRLAASNTDSVGAEVFIGSGGLTNLSFFIGSTTTPATQASGWRTPTTEVTVAMINAALLRTAQTFTSATGALRVQELYLDLDVRARPTIASVVPSIVLGEPTFAVTFSYNTSGFSESVTIQAVVRNTDTGELQGTLFQTVSGIDFSATVANVLFPASLPFGTYSVETTIIAGGFVAPNTTFNSVANTTLFSVTPAGVAPPDLTCETSQADQYVTLEICQPDDTPPADVNCLVMATFVLGSKPTGAWTTTSNVPVGGTPRHAELWIDNVLVTTQLAFSGTGVTVTVPSTNVLSGTARLVVAYTIAAAVPNTQLVAQNLSSPGTIVHSLLTANLIVQARDTATGLQAEVGVTILDSNSIAISGPFTQNITVLVLAQVAANAICVPTTNESVVATTQNQVFVHQFASTFTLATTVQTADGRLSWMGIELNSGSVVVDNDGGAATLHLSGILATFDDPDAVRAEVQRDGQLIPLDGLNGALVPPFGEGCLTVVDRFPDRVSPALCEGDVVPAGPIYQVRFYGYVDGVIAYSPWAQCQPDAIVNNGKALLRSVTDGSLDQMVCTSDEPFGRVRPMSGTQPVAGGKPYVRSAAWGGRNYSLVIETPTTADALAVEAVLEATYFWYSPLDPGLPAVWLAPEPSTSFQSVKIKGRPYTIAQATLEIDPEPVLLPPAGPTLS